MENLIVSAVGKRWSPGRKAGVVEMVRMGELSLEEACVRFDLSTDEFNAWAGALDRHGVPGLRVTRLQIYDETRLRPARRR
jgi:hypothetical protein